jgi:hypothetical protein
MPSKNNKLTGVILLIFLVIASCVSAYVFQSGILTSTQNIIEVTTIDIQLCGLGDINEGETRYYTELELPSLHSAVSITTTTAPVYLHFTSNLDSLIDSYSTFNINILYDTVPPGGPGSGTAGTLSLTSHDLTTPITLYVAGTWEFDLVIETTAKSVDINTPSSVSILVEAKNTN